MCGRFVVNERLTLPGLFEPDDLTPNYNVAPTTPIALARQRHGTREITRAHWGFVPPWATSMKQRPQPINARIETVSSSGMFRKAFASGRCIIPASGYYEWTITETGKQPHYIFDPDNALAMAGIVTAWRDPAKTEDDETRWVLSTAIITRDAHVAPGEVHDRMPACLTPDAYHDWLSPELDTASALAILDRESLEVAHRLTHYEVSRDVNSVRNNGPQLLRPLPADPA
ncbi:SOS response-associated peptidase [Galbitalea soli]|uniref:Abasic site processing protein n=1 Tax=Galbitalea soli TaxID=1268042 RepID=A0A7C9TRK2_9MICO|nr:SOS response-associated peptidase [Galbitalea soli]NEM92256.1 SOS response-associated peptidase [Galbitalea soli]NYJ31788.1 putative SOS response-associated peptidase YedK [Galbitalea soli]